jgi:radical SAM family protein
MSPPVALVYPPTCDPTAPYLSVPTLTGYLRHHGLAVMPIDANVEAWDALLRRAPLAALAAQLERRLARLEGKPRLGHTEQLAYAALWRARGDADAAPAEIEPAVALLRGQRGDFYDPEQYAAAVATVESAARLVSAAHTPLEVDFTAYRTPFSLLDADEIAADARAERDPFHPTFVALAARLRHAGVTLVGISVAFPGQIQPAYSLAHLLRRELPGAHVTLGGPAVTQILARIASGPRLERALGPFHSAILFEGERALLGHARAAARGAELPTGVIRGEQTEDLSQLPPPDFDGLPLDKYLAPELVLPYDPTRGCYWGVCTFCHYGLAEVGTARYRERPVATTMGHLEALAARHGVRVFYFSQDSVSPRAIAKIAGAIRDQGRPWRWATDMRPERSLTVDKCRDLAEGGGLAVALGVESAAPRVLKLIDKGLPVAAVRDAIGHLHAAGMAVEAMCFTDFPTETHAEAMATVRFLDELRDELALFICGEFDLTHGALVAQRPQDFGIAETWQLDGDELGTGLFYRERRPPKSEAEAERLDAALAELSSRWRLRRYPWAGAVSTAHTLLYYQRFGPEIFKDLATAPARVGVPGARARVGAARFDVARVAATSRAREAEIWRALVHERRRVSRALYRELAAAAPPAEPSPGRWRTLAGHEPAPLGGRPAPRGQRAGRRPSHAVNAAKP